jgi:mono/diheme cytochrome c family protein
MWALTLGVRSMAQDAPEPTRSTTAGVYSATQAQAGQAIFESTCLGGCHNLSSHKGLAFKQHFDGRVVWELYSVILETMPKDDQGSLTPADAAQLVAYMLKLNGLPAGKDDLPVDAAELKRIRIELPKSGDLTWHDD